jgi:CRISPR-associated protein Csd1
MVRDWMEGQFEDLVRNVKRWFDDLEIVAFDGKHNARPPKMERVITCLLPPRHRDQSYADWIKPLGATRVSLWHAAVCGEPIEYSVLARLVVLDKALQLSGKVEEVTAERKHPDFPAAISLLHARMSLMKAYHLRQPRQKGGKGMSDLKPSLNEHHPDPAYHCGRLMAILARIQKEALGREVGSGVVQRYYAAFSVAPGLHAGRLISLANHHLSALYRDKPGLAHYLESLLESVMVRIGDNFPPPLDLEKQSLFALGYYQQMAYRGTPETVIEKTQEGDNNG